MRRVNGAMALCGAALLATASMTVAATGCTRVEASTLDPQEVIHSATVTVADRCAGVVIQPNNFVLTAAHCVNEGEAVLSIAMANGEAMVGTLASIDRDRDLAVLQLPNAAPVNGLRVSESLAEPGTGGYFAARPDRGGSLQRISVVRVGRCPSLPRAPAALFTSLRGEPGDSGAPVVTEDLEVIGLVHGGAACSIAAPTDAVPMMLKALANRS